MNEYYDELALGGDFAQTDGWRHRLEQWLRFEAVIRGLAIDEQASVVDLGCGTGRLFEYLSRRRRGSYLGVDQLSRSVEMARQSLPDGQFMVADFGSPSIDAAGPFDYALAIGTLVDGQRRNDDERRRHLVRWVGRLDKLGKNGWALVVLDQDRLEADPIRRLEDCLQGARGRELEEILRRKEIEAYIDTAVLPGTLIVLADRNSENSQVAERIEGELVHNAILAKYAEELEALTDDELGWFWLICERFERARRHIEGLADGHRRKSILMARLSEALGPLCATGC